MEREKERVHQFRMYLSENLFVKRLEDVRSTDGVDGNFSSILPAQQLVDLPLL